ncbi:hypothetical protein GCM10028787_00120 [Brachybacterium horti]
MSGAAAIAASAASTAAVIACSSIAGPPGAGFVSDTGFAFVLGCSGGAGREAGTADHSRRDARASGHGARPGPRSPLAWDGKPDHC